MRIIARRILLVFLSVVLLEVAVNILNPWNMARHFLSNTYVTSDGGASRTGDATAHNGVPMRLLGNHTSGGNSGKQTRIHSIVSKSNTQVGAGKGSNTSAQVSMASTSGKRIITIVYPLGRLGNKLFIYASMIGVGLNREMEPQLFGKGCTALTSYFECKLHCNNSLSNVAGNLEKFANAKAAAYDERVETLSNNSTHKALAITGYMQSWKYFHNCRSRILEHLTFTEKIRNKTHTFLQAEFAKLPQGLAVSDSTLVGIHVRRTDMATQGSHKQGYMEAPKEYIWLAMDKMDTLLSNDSKPSVFIVTSDDITWCRSVIQRKNRTVIFSTSRNEGVDLALLANCDHTIITTGTYGWWGAYIAGGHTIYYSRYPRPNTYVGRLTNVTDYYPPDWIPLP